jgi:putative RecB family exonuclease
MDSISSSQVTCYLGCPLQYKFRYVDRLPRPWRSSAMAFGSSIHAAIEWFQRERLARRVPLESAVVSMFLADWYAQTVEPLVFSDGESKESLSEKGSEMIRVYVRAAAAAAVPSAVEERFSVGLVDAESWEELDVALHWVIDLVESDGTVVDLKTAGRSFDVGSIERHLQLSIYALAVLVRDGNIPKLRIDALLKTKVPRLERYDLHRNHADLAWAARLIQGVVQSIDSEQFFPNPSWRCAECEYYAQCQAWRGR